MSIIAVSIRSLVAKGFTLAEIENYTGATLIEIREDAYGVATEKESKKIRLMVNDSARGYATPLNPAAPAVAAPAAPEAETAQPGWSKAAKSRRGPRFEGGCGHHETSNTGSCYECGAYVKSEDIGAGRWI